MIFRDGFKKTVTEIVNYDAQRIFSEIDWNDPLPSYLYGEQRGSIQDYKPSDYFFDTLTNPYTIEDVKIGALKHFYSYNCFCEDIEDYAVAVRSLAFEIAAIKKLNPCRNWDGHFKDMKQENIQPDFTDAFNFLRCHVITGISKELEEQVAKYPGGLAAILRDHPIKHDTRGIGR